MFSSFFLIFIEFLLMPITLLLFLVSVWALGLFVHSLKFFLSVAFRVVTLFPFLDKMSLMGELLTVFDGFRKTFIVINRSKSQKYVYYKRNMKHFTLFNPLKTRNLSKEIKPVKQDSFLNYGHSMFKNNVNPSLMNTITLSIERNRSASFSVLKKGLMLFSLLMAFVIHESFGQTTYTSTTAGNWSTVTWSPAGTPGPGDNVIINTNVSVNTVVEINELTVNASRTLTINDFNFTVIGETNVLGTITDINSGGANTFNGQLTVASGATFTNTSSSAYIFSGDIINNGTFSKNNTGSSTLDASLSISGSSSLSFVGPVIIGPNAIINSTADINLVSGLLNGSNAGSTWINGAGSSLDYKNVAEPMVAGSFQASGAGNTVNYSGINQTVKSATYHNLILSGSGTKQVPDVTIGGNFSRTGVSVNFTGSTIIFTGSSPATYTYSGAQTFPNVVINKAGSSLTFAPTGSLTTTFGSLTISLGTLNMGTTANTLIIQGDLSGAGSINMAGANHTMNLGGASSAIGGLITAAATGSSTINYNRAGDQTMLSSINCKNITLSGSGQKSLSGGTAADGVLNFSTNVLLVLDNNNFKLSPSGTLLPTAAGSWGPSRMIVSNGDGMFVKEGISIAHFLTNLPGGRFPVGSNGFYSPMTITSLTGSFSGTGAIAVRAVPERQPNVPYFNNALIKYWDVETTNINGITASVRFNFAPAEVIGSVALYEPRVWNGTALSTVANPSTAGSNPFFSNGSGFLAGQWTAIDPTTRTTLYSYQSGAWADANTWTTDPSGSTLVSPIVPGPGDQVVILNGRTVTSASSRVIGSLNIQDGGILDIGSTTGNDFGVVEGKGILRLSSINFPGGSYAQFVSSNGGTVEYYNLTAGTNVLASSQNTYNNLNIISSNATSYSLSMFNGNLTVNGNLLLNRTSTGSPTFLLGGTTGGRQLQVFGNVTVNAGTNLGVSTFNATHRLNIEGSLIVNGSIDLQNGAAYTNSSSGEAIINFFGATANTVASFGATANAQFFDFNVVKNEGYELFVSASPSSVVNFHSSNKTVDVVSGTLRLGPNINIPRLNGPSGGNYDIGSAGVTPTFWIDGATVADGAVSGAIVPYGTIRITSGSLTCSNGQRSVVIRESGFLKIEGGVVNMGLFRTSVTAVTHRGAFDMSGGTLNMLGNGTQNSYAVFSLAYPENVFNMTGGTINITKTTTGGITPDGGIMIASSPQNYNVTGGTVNVNVTGNRNFDISSTAPFFNLNIGQISSGSGRVRLNDIDWSFDGSNGNRATINSQPLVVLNNLNINSGNTAILDARDNDVVVGGNFLIANGATLNSGNNSLIFNGNSSQQFTINGDASSASSIGGTNFINGPENIVPGGNYTFERLTSASNVEMAPNGTMTAERIMEASGNGVHRWYTPFIPTTGPITASIYVKPNGRNCVSLQLGRFGGTVAIAWFNLTGSGSVISTNGNVISAGITSEPNGWYRIHAVSNGNSDYRMRLYLGNGSCSESYNGNPSLGIYAWGTVVESGIAPSAYATGAPAAGINSLEINKANGSVVTIAGSATAINVNGNLRVNTGILNIGGKTMSVAANIVNNTEIQGTTLSEVRMFGTSIQSIFGNGNGSFVNLTLDNTGGAAGDAQVNMLANFTIQNQLELVSSRVFAIGNFKLTLPAAASIVATSGPFSQTKFIRTGGFLSDGGIDKTYSSSTTTFTFPFGSGTNYTPATIAFAAAPTAYGSLNVRPVNAQQLYVTDPQALPYYWKVNSNGFSGIPANSMNLSFNYGTLPDDVAYIPGYYNFQEIAYTTINDVNAVDEVSNVISFNSFDKLDGDFTAGAPAAFGVVVPYYSRTNGNWNTPSTWSNDPILKYTGVASSTIPSGSVPVFIGDGTTSFHSVTVTTDNTLAGSLIIDAGSTLDVGTTVGNNFGALPFATAGGAGTIRINSATPVAEFPAGDFGLFFTLDGGTAEYYSASTSFTLPELTAAPTNMVINTYKALTLNPSASASVTLSDSDIEILQDFRINGNASGLANFSDASERNTTVRGNLSVNSGILRFGSMSEQVLHVDGNIVIGNAGRFDVANAGSINHNIFLLGGITNNGTLQFNQASIATINFIGENSRSVSGTNASASTNFGNVVVDKGSSAAILLNVDVAGSLSAPSDSWLSLVNGTFRLSKPGSLTLTNQAGSNFVIPANTALSVNHVGATVNVGMVNDNDADLIVAGKLEILNGTLNVGNSSHGSHNDIEYAATNIPEIVISGNGTLNVNGQIRRSTSVLLGSLAYTQSGNSTVLVRGKNSEGASSFNLNRAKFEVLNSGSSFNMSDNSLLIIDRSGNASGAFGDIYLAPTSSSITGGEIIIGTSSTPPASANFILNSTIGLWDLTIDGTITNKTATLQGNPITIKNNLSILNSSVFNTNGLNVTIGGGLINQNPNATASLTFGGYRAQNANQVTTFSGLSMSPNIMGVSGNLTNFANVIFNNSFIGGSYNIGANTNVRFNGNMSILNGTLDASDNTVTVTGNIINNGIHTSTLPGYLVLSGSANQTVSGNGSGQFGNIRLNNSAGVDLLSSATINGDLNFTGGILYINNHLLTLGVNASTSGTLNQSSMIRLNGVLSDAGLRKLYPASAQDFTFPIGVTLKYSPARINVTSNNTAGSVTIKPVNVKHPATTDSDDLELTYYWSTSATGFSPATVVTHTYNYLQTDATNGDETQYRVGRYFNNIWVPQFGIPSSINATANTMTLSGVDYFNGDYTAGEQSEFDQLFVYYSRNATLGGAWSDVNSWSTDPVLMHAGAPAASAPAFNSIVIAAGHTINVSNDNRSAATAIIDGTLNLNGTIGHNLGTVSGTGTIRMTPTISNQYIFPGGNYATFVNVGGGTIEYNSVSTSTLPSQGTYNNIVFSGAGNKNLFNTDLVINGNMTILAGTVENSVNRNVSLKGNLTNNSGIAGFNTSSGLISLTGADQIITGATSFGRLAINGAGVKTLNSSILISSELNLIDGIIATGSNVVTILNNANVLGASSASYVNGNLQKNIASATASKNFEIGDASSYAPLTVFFTGTTNNVGSLTAFTSAGDHPNAATSGIDPSKSVNRFWSIQNVGVTGFTDAAVQFNFNTLDLDPSVNANNLSVGRFNSSIWSLETVGVRTPTSTQTTGLTTFGQFQLAEPFSAGITWTGAVNGDWNNPGNWNPNLVPSGSDNITIPVVTNQPNFLSPGNGLVRNTVLESGAILTIPAGYKLTVNGNWTGTSARVDGDGNVEFTSPTAQVNGTTTFNSVVSVLTGSVLNTNNSLVLGDGASLMHGVGTPGAGGSVVGTVKIQRTGTSSGISYNYWSSPITGASLNTLGGNIYRYEPSSASGADVEGLRAGWVSPGSIMTPGRGYISTGAGTVTFNGIPNNGSISFGPLVQATFTDFNLIGNPYPSAISASDFVSANPQFVGGALYFWDDDNSSGADYDQTDYGVWNSVGFVGPNSGAPFNGFIASGQGFFVETSSSSSVTFNNSMRRTQNDDFFSAGPMDRIWLNVITPQGNYNETLIAFKQDATDGADLAYDAKKLPGNEELAFYTKISNENYAIQALSELNLDKVVQLGVMASAAGQQTISIKHIDGLTNTAQIILEDTKTGSFINLRIQNQYTYSFNPATDENRFRLHFKPEVTFSTSTESCIQNDGELIINSPSNTAWEYTITSSTGELIAESEAFTGTESINGLHGGVYIISMNNSFGTQINQAVEIASGAPVLAAIQASETNVDLNQGFIQFTSHIQGASDITWDFGDGSIVAGVANPTHIYTQPGTYTVTFIASNATCMDVKTIEITVRDLSTGISSVGTQVFSMYPNPASDVASIKLNLPEREKEISLFLVDGSGKLIKSLTFNQIDTMGTINLDVSDVATGVYQVLINGEKISSSARLTISR